MAVVCSPYEAEHIPCLARRSRGISIHPEGEAASDPRSEQSRKIDLSTVHFVIATVVCTVLVPD